MAHIFRALTASIWRRYASLVIRERTGIPKMISDHNARDIGMTRAQLERHRFVWPSQSPDRPLL